MLIGFFFTILISFIQGKDPHSISYENLGNYTNNIIVIRGKTNKTKCFAKYFLNEGDILFKYTDEQIFSSDYCLFKNKEEIKHFVSTIVNDTLETNRIVLAFYLLLESKNKTSEVRNYFSSLNFNEDLSKLNWDRRGILDYSISGKEKELGLSQVEHLKKTFRYIISNFTLNIKENDFLKIYFYILENSFILEDKEIIIFPYLDACNIYPYFLTIRNETFDMNLYSSNAITIERIDDNYYIKANRSFAQKEHFFFAYNRTLLSNRYLLSNLGEIARNNIYNDVGIQFSFNFSSSEQINRFFEHMKKKLDLSWLNYLINKEGNEVLFTCYLKEVKLNDSFLKFLLYHQDFLAKDLKRKYSISYKVKLYHFSFFKIIRQNIFRIANEMGSVEKYINELKEKKLTKTLNKIHLFNLENLKMLTKHQSTMYESSIGNMWKSIENFKVRYGSI